MIRKNKGFTLIELLIVMAIIAILAAVVIPQVLVYSRSEKASIEKVEPEKVLEKLNIK